MGSAHETATEEDHEGGDPILGYLMTPLAFAGMLGIASAARNSIRPPVIYKLPDQISWGPVNAAGAQNAVVVGDPTKPGFYMVYNRWSKGNHFSRPHFMKKRDWFFIVCSVGAILFFGSCSKNDKSTAGTTSRLAG